MKLITSLLAAILLTSAAHGALDFKNSIVKIYTIQNPPDYYNPWSMRGPRQGTGSGFIIKGKKLITNAHVVADETFIQVRKHGEVTKYVARVSAVSHETDLAVLEVDDPKFFENTVAVELGDLPQSQQEVLVYGFPLGGDTMSITKGVVSRVEHQTYAHASGWFLAGQIDAAINPGNSGGPVLMDGKLAGVVMQSISQADNIGYMVPVNLLKHFLEDLEDGHYDGYPGLGVVFQDLESPAMRDRHGLSSEQHGMLINKVAPGSAADGILKPGDVMMKIGGYPVEDNGTIEFRPNERTSIAYAVQEMQVGESIEVVVLRDGSVQTVQIPLARAGKDDWLIAAEDFDVMPTYYIYGGLLFSPLSKSYLMAWGPGWYNNAPKHLVAALNNNVPEVHGEEVVMLVKVLAADVNQGYHNFSHWIVKKVDGEKILNLKDLIARIEKSDKRFVEFENDGGQIVVLDREKVSATHQVVLDRYRIPKDRSEDL